MEFQGIEGLEEGELKIGIRKIGMRNRYEELKEKQFFIEKVVGRVVLLEILIM